MWHPEATILVCLSYSLHNMSFWGGRKRAYFCLRVSAKQPSLRWRPSPMISEPQLVMSLSLSLALSLFLLNFTQVALRHIKLLFPHLAPLSFPSNGTAGPQKQAWGGGGGCDVPHLSSHAPSNCSASRTELLPWFFSCIAILPFPSLMLLRVSGNCVSDALDRLKTSLSPTLPREELESFVSSGVLSHLQLSFSRDHQDGADGTGRYVQDNLKLQGRHITHILLQQKGSIYICGWDWRRHSAAAIIICCYHCLKRVPLSTRNTRYVLDERNPLPSFVPAHGWWFIPPFL